jgi:hypothetical protein
MNIQNTTLSTPSILHTPLIIKLPNITLPPPVPLPTPLILSIEEFLLVQLVITPANVLTKQKRMDHTKITKKIPVKIPIDLNMVKKLSASLQNSILSSNYAFFLSISPSPLTQTF